MSETKVVNCKVSHIRPKYKDLSEWVKDPNNVYIARSGIVFVSVDGKKERFPKQSSPFANPFKINAVTTREQVIEKYKSYILEKIEKNQELKKSLLELKGKNLGCWCYPEKCHGDVLKELIDRVSE